MSDPDTRRVICEGQPSSGANAVTVFLGPDADRARDAVLARPGTQSSDALTFLQQAVFSRGFSSSPDASSYIVAPTTRELEKVYPHGRCAKCGGTHTQKWILVFSFHVPNRRGKRTTGEAIQSWSTRFNAKINEQDSHDCLYTGDFEWFVDIADSTGSFVVALQKNSEWLYRSAQAIEAAYQLMGGRGATNSASPAGKGCAGVALLMAGIPLTILLAWQLFR